jgi:hypothetical protein
MSNLFELIETDNVDEFTKALTESKDPNRQNADGVFFSFI